ncbi:MAG: antirestriction protein ArdA [Syntrophomonadaceae bacterium]
MNQNKEFEEKLLELARSESPITAFVTNLGKYNEGDLVGEWLPLPTTTEQVQACLKRIGLDGIRYEEYFITDYETSANGLYDHLPEYAKLDELNYLASKLDELPDYEIKKLEAVLEHDGSYYGGSVKDLINLTENLDCFDYLQSVHDEEDLGYYWIEESGCYNLKDMGNLANYFDYERFGRDIAIDESGTFTNNGYIRSTGDSFTEIYDGREIPEEYRVFAYPPKGAAKNKGPKNRPERSHDER